MSNETATTVVVETIDLNENPPATTSPTSSCTNKSLKTTIYLLSFVSVALAIALSYFAYPTLTPTSMDDATSSKHVQNTRYHFSGGEEEVEKFYSKPTLTELDTSNSRFKRFDAAFEAPSSRRLSSYPIESDAYAAGVTHMMNEAGEITHEMRLEVLEGGAATLGEFADENGQVGTKSLRVSVLIKKTMDRFYLIPIGLSMTPNQTLWPDLFYFSFHKHGTLLSKRVVSFCSTAAYTNTSVQCFLGKGQTEWETSVAPWAVAYMEGMQASANENAQSRRLHWWNSKSSASAAPTRHTKWHKPAEEAGAKAGGWAGNKEGSKIGGKIGGEIGGKIGGEVGEVAGTAAGGAVAGPVGAAVGGEVGHWAGKKIGTKIGTKIGSKVGGEVGTKVGTKIGGAAGGWAGDHIGTKCDGCD